MEPDSSRPLKKGDFNTVVKKAKALAKSSFDTYRKNNKADIEKKIKKEFNKIDKQELKEKVSRRLEKDFFEEEVILDLAIISCNLLIIERLGLKGFLAFNYKNTKMFSPINIVLPQIRCFS